MIYEDTTIRVDDDLELAFWSREFNVSATALEQAIAAVGPRVSDVMQFLNKAPAPPDSI